MNILDFKVKKNRQEKISMVTCYDYTSARLLAHTSLDCILVGDSVAMTIHGFKNTLAATLAMMSAHTSAVSRGCGDKFIVSDLPFLSYRKSLSDSIAAASELMQAGAHAVKLEGAAGNEAFIQHLTESGVPVMGHLGLTPQLINTLGGHKVQGKTVDAAKRIQEDALKLEAAGCFALVLECVPAQVAKDITESLTIPTIGIGAGPDTDGQVLVYQDLLGLNLDFKPKFVKSFIEGHLHVRQGVENYISAMKNGEFPRNEHCYQN